MAFTSDMIPRMVYLYAYSEHKNMEGYIDNSLSMYNISQIDKANMPEDYNATTTITDICRYQGKSHKRFNSLNEYVFIRLNTSFLVQIP